MQRDYLIRERVSKALVLFALPIILGNLFQQLYTMIDQIVVGQYVGETALAAVGASYAVTNVFISVAIGGGMGASVIVSTLFGQKDFPRMKTAVFTAFFFFFGLSVVLGLIGFFVCAEFMTALKTPSDALPMSVSYLKIYFLGLPFLFMYNVVSAAYNALGRSKFPLLFLIISSVLNVGLDYLFVAGLNWGVSGAALATLIAQGGAFFLSFFVFLKQLKGFESGKFPLFSLPLLGKMLRIALPSVLQQSTVSIGMLFVQSVVNDFGSSVLAGYSAAGRVQSLCIVPIVGMGNAVTSFTAQNQGAERPERIFRGFKFAICYVLIVSAVLCAALEGFSRSIVALFCREPTEEVLTTGVGYLRFIGFFFAVFGIKIVFDSLLRGTKNMLFFTLASFSNLTLRVVLAVTLAPRISVAFVWYAVPIGWAVNVLITSIQLFGRVIPRLRRAVRAQSTAS